MPALEKMISASSRNSHARRGRRGRAAAAAAALRDPEMAMGMPSSCGGFELTLRMRLALGHHGDWEHPGCGG